MAETAIAEDKLRTPVVGILRSSNGCLQGRILYILRILGDISQKNYTAMGKHTNTQVKEIQTRKVCL
jgi:hypothetical protein